MRALSVKGVRKDAVKTITGQRANDVGVELLGHERRRQSAIRSCRWCHRREPGRTAIDPGGDSFSRSEERRGGEVLRIIPGSFLDSAEALSPSSNLWLKYA